MLKTSRSTELTTQPGEGVIGVNSDNKARRNGSKLNRSEFDRSEIHDVKVDSGKIDNEIRKKGQKMSKFKNLLKSKKLSKSKKTLESNFFTSGAGLAFTKLREVFVKALILYHFELKYYIRVETDISSYAIGGVFSRLTLDDLSQ